MTIKKTILSVEEKNWILERRFTRLYDNQEVLIYPMGAERYLFSVLSGKKPNRYPIINDIKAKDVLVIPGYGNNGFLFAEAGANSVTVYDKDPVTVAWMKAFKLFYHYRQYDKQGRPYPSIGEILIALTCWYPPLISLPKHHAMNVLLWAINPNGLRKKYIHYMIFLVVTALKSKKQQDYALQKNIQFYAGDIEQLSQQKKVECFETIYVPYLLGVRNGIENQDEIVDFIKKMTQIFPKGKILVSPSQNTKEFYVVGKRYFTTADLSKISMLPGLAEYVEKEDSHWFRTQGLTVFTKASKA